MQYFLKASTVKEFYLWKKQKHWQYQEVSASLFAEKHKNYKKRKRKKTKNTKKENK
jgi:hypothetical protein